MENKYKIGDTVLVIGNINDPKYVGRIGKIIEFAGDLYPYRILLAATTKYEKDIEIFGEEELLLLDEDNKDIAELIYGA